MVHILIANREHYETHGMNWLLKSTDPTLTVSQVYTSIDLLSAVEKSPIDILIVELELITGNNADQIRKWINIVRPKVIGLTLEPTFEKAMKAIELGVTKLLIKPVSPQQLQHSIQKITREKKALVSSDDVLKSKKNRISLSRFFRDDQRNIHDHVLIGFKTENKTELNTLHTFLSEYSFRMDVTFYLLPDEVIGISQDKRYSWQEECQRMLRDWQLQKNEPLSIVVYTPSENGTMHNHYLQLKKLLEVTFFVGYNQVLHYSKEITWRAIDPFLTHTEQKLWIDYLNHSNINEIREWLFKEFLHYESSFPDPGLIRIRLTSILAQIRRYMNQDTIFHKLEDHYLSLFNEILYSTIIYRSIQEIILLISKIFHLKDEKYHFPKGLIDKCIDYMETNYWNNQLNLDEVSAVFNRNPTYLSSLFVQKKGKSFRELLNSIRIEQAKKLLLETELSIKQISSLCGYTRQQYFSRVFNVNTGLTPNKFRSKHIP